jgi:hypothetical protein
MQINSQKRSNKMNNSLKTRQVVRGMSQSICIALLLLSCCVLSAQNEERRVRNIVLVHGAWADGSGWKGVYDILVKDGYKVSIVQEPETSVKEDVAATPSVYKIASIWCSQLWRRRNHRSGTDPLLLFGPHRGPHARCWRE